jgi:hypothetical protein
MQSELDDPNFKNQVIAALETKLALARGLEPPVKQYKRLVQWHDEQTAISLLNNCPVGFYVKLCNRQHRSLQDQHATYSVPVPTGAPINIPKLLAWFHNFLATHGPKLKAIAEGKDRKAALEERKLESEIAVLNARMVDIEISVSKKQGNVVPVEEVRHAFSWLASEIRKFGERLGAKFGADSQRFLNEFLERVEQDVVEYVPPSIDGESQPGEGAL